MQSLYNEEKQEARNVDIIHILSSTLSICLRKIKTIFPPDVIVCCTEMIFTVIDPLYTGWILFSPCPHRIQLMTLF